MTRHFTLNDGIETPVDGRFQGLILTDSDIIGMKCNFFNSKTNHYDGADVRSSHNDLDFDFIQYYDFPKVVCETETIVNGVYLTKSIPSIIQTNAAGSGGSE